MQSIIRYIGYIPSILVFGIGLFGWHLTLKTRLARQNGKISRSKRVIRNHTKSVHSIEIR